MRNHHLVRRISIGSHTKCLRAEIMNYKMPKPDIGVSSTVSRSVWLTREGEYEREGMNIALRQYMMSGIIHIISASFEAKHRKLMYRRAVIKTAMSWSSAHKIKANLDCGDRKIRRSHSACHPCGAQHGRHNGNIKLKWNVEHRRPCR